MASDGDKKQPSNTGAKLIHERSMNKETLVCIVYISQIANKKDNNLKRINCMPTQARKMIDAFSMRILLITYMTVVGDGSDHHTIDYRSLLPKDPLIKPISSFHFKFNTRLSNYNQ